MDGRARPRVPAGAADVGHPRAVSGWPHRAVRQPVACVGHRLQATSAASRGLPGKTVQHAGVERTAARCPPARRHPRSTLLSASIPAAPPHCIHHCIHACSPAAFPFFYIEPKRFKHIIDRFNPKAVPIDQFDAIGALGGALLLGRSSRAAALGGRT